MPREILLPGGFFGILSPWLRSLCERIIIFSLQSSCREDFPAKIITKIGGGWSEGRTKPIQSVLESPLRRAFVCTARKDAQIKCRGCPSLVWKA